MYRKSISIIIALCLVVTMFTGVAVAEESSGIAIKGNGVEKEVKLTRTQLEAMSTDIQKNTYSSANNFPTEKITYAEGVSLEALLKKAGIKKEAAQIKFVASDGYSRTFTYDELMNQDRYYFGKDGKSQKVAPIVGLKTSDKGFDSMEKTDMVLMMGQRVKGEQNNPWFVKLVSEIQVLTDTKESWSQVTFDRAANPAGGIDITPKHKELDKLKIYYTTDGSEPSINSNLYNVSATYYQPDLNRAININKNTEIKAVAIGAGKSNSAIASLKVVLDGADQGTTDKNKFTDLAEFAWAAEAINTLADKKVINGMGDGTFVPKGNLTRGQFATIMVLALNEKPIATGSKSFSDVSSNAWYAGYVLRGADMGLINGYTDGTFRPDNFLSKEEMLTIIVNAMGKQEASKNIDESLKAVFSDERRISSWALNNVALAESLGIVEHGHMSTEKDKKRVLDGKGYANRAEAAVSVNNMLKVK